MKLYDLACVLVPLALVATPAAAADGETTYAVSGTGIDNASYEGTAIITRAPGSCKITWRTPSEFKGICLEYEGVMLASYDSGSQKGLVFYKIESNGSLAGVWNTEGAQGLGTEILTPKSGGGSGAGGSNKVGIGASGGAGASSNQ